MRKRLVVLVLVFLLLCLAPANMFALETNQAANKEIGPLWISITEFTNSFDISSNGLADFDTSLYARSGINKVVITASIQKYVNGSWTSVKTWTSTSLSNSGYIAQEWYLVSGSYYRLVSTGTVYQNNVLVEQTSYTGPSYWY